MTANAAYWRGKPEFDHLTLRFMGSDAARMGCPKGFELTLHTSADRFPGDGAIGQALGQMFARGGLRVNGVNAVPYSVYASEATQRKYSAFVFSFGGFAGNSAEGLRGVLATFDAAKGTGALNRARYSNAASCLSSAVGWHDKRIPPCSAADYQPVEP